MCKEKQAVIKDGVMDREMEKNFKLGAKEEKRDHFRFYMDGLVLEARDKFEE